MENNMHLFFKGGFIIIIFYSDQNVGIKAVKYFKEPRTYFLWISSVQCFDC